MECNGELQQLVVVPVQDYEDLVVDKIIKYCKNFYLINVVSDRVDFQRKADSIFLAMQVVWIDTL